MPVVSKQLKLREIVCLSNYIQATHTHTHRLEPKKNLLMSLESWSSEPRNPRQEATTQYSSEQLVSAIVFTHHLRQYEPKQIQWLVCGLIRFVVIMPLLMMQVFVVYTCFVNAVLWLQRSLLQLQRSSPHLHPVTNTHPGPCQTLPSHPAHAYFGGSALGQTSRNSWSWHITDDLDIICDYMGVSGVVL